MAEENSGTESAVDIPKNDYVLTSDKAEVKAEPAPEAATPPKEPVEDHDEDDESQEQNNDPAKKPKRGGFQKKIAKAEAERDFYRDRYEAMERERSGTTQAKTEPSKSDDANGPQPEDYPSTQEWIDARADWRALKALNKHEETKQTEAKKAEDTKAFQEKLQKYEASKADARAKYADFDEMVSQYDGVQLQKNLATAILDSEFGSELTYTISKDRELFEKLNAPGLSEAQISRMIGRVEARLEKSEAPKAAVKTSSAPPPIKPVSPSAKAAAGKFYEGMSYEDYKKLPKSERG